ncbi:MAG: DUF6029 family protein [Candidatus Kapaibacterium sp.]
MRRSTLSAATPLAAIAAVIIGLASHNSLHAQPLQYSISNEFRYGIGQRFEQDQEFTKEYLENLLNTRLYVGDFTVGFRLQVDKPREYGRDTVGVKEYYAEFQRDGLRVRGGTFYNLVGRGLVFNTFESRPIGFDTQTEGVKINYESPEFSAGAYGGLLDYVDILDPSRIEPYLVRGASGEVRPIKEITLGGSFLSASGRKLYSFTRAFDSYLREAYVGANSGGFRGFFNYSDKRTPDSTIQARFGHSGYGYGMYGMVGYSNEDVGVTAEIKDYRYNLVTPDVLGINSRPTRALPFQNPPNLVPEYDKALLARNPHAIDFSDELGFQLETLIYPTENLTVTILGAGASRHNSWEARQLIDTSGAVAGRYYQRLNDKPLSFANLSDPKFSPYWEAYVHGEYHVSDDLSFALGLQRRDNTTYLEGRGDSSSRPIAESYKASTAILESIMNVGERDNLHAILELQHIYDSQKERAGTDSLAAADGRFNNVLLTLEYAHSPKWAVNTRIEWTTTDQEQGGRRIWPVVGATYRIGDAHTIGVQYGAERGGVVCTGGVCRLINPFDGFRLTIVSKL